MKPLGSLLLDPESKEGIALFYDRLPVQLLAAAGLLILQAIYVVRVRSTAAPALGLVLLVAAAWGNVFFHRSFNETLPASILNYKPEHLELLRPPDDGRLYVYDYGQFEGRADKYLRRPGPGATSYVGLVGVSPEASGLIASRAYLTPLTGAFWRIDYAWDVDLRLLFDRRLARLTIALRQLEETPGMVKLLQISGVSRVAARHQRGFEQLPLVGRRPIFYPDDLLVFDVPGHLPRAHLTGGRVTSSGSDLRDLLDERFDPARAVVVDRGPARPPSPDFSGTARVVDRRADRVVVETDSNGPGFLTILEGFMPGWRVSIDGTTGVLERANAIFVGTEVSAGRHRVEFRFLPRSAVIGVGLTVLTGTLLFFALLMRSRTGSDAPSTASE